MNFSLEEKEQIAILRLHEERLDTDIAHDLKVQILALFNKDKTKVLLDLKDVQYADSTGLGAILFGIRQARNFSGELKLVHLNERVLSLIRIAKLDYVIEAFDNEPEALESFSKE
ncbi:MAG: anti-sigma factor antagonist [Calditrichaeota bacterium]|nr:MAG: anti-sigma factor antagonist [Calditrichota bacterium]